MVYLDNAATSFPKPDCIIRDLNFCLRKYCGNPGRSGHALSIEAGERIYEVRELVADFLNYENPECVVFTYNATYALNLAIKTKITKKCHIIISDAEHNAVLRPIESLKEKLGVEYSVFKSSGDIRASIESAIRDDTECIVSTLQSNVTGRKIPLDILSDVAKRHGLYLIVDASQIIGHEKIDLKRPPATFCVLRDTRRCSEYRAVALLYLSRRNGSQALLRAEAALNQKCFICHFNYPRDTRQAHSRLPP